MSRTLHACHLGPTPYAEGLRIQEELVRSRADGATGDWLLFPDHPSVLTVGRSAAPGSVIASPGALRERGIEVHEVARGGDVTWHGPGQLVGYTIVALDAHGRDLHRFIREMERVLVDVLAAVGIEGETIAGRTGVWTHGAKIASIGIAVRRWVSYHGFALNVAPDLSFFDLIHPCGLRGIQMTSIERERGAEAAGIEAIRGLVAARFADRFGYDEVIWAGLPPEARCGSVSAAGPRGERHAKAQPGAEEAA